jgi:CubicO group peptidase (beta-lactamase class C family)
MVINPFHVLDNMVQNKTERGKINDEIDHSVTISAEEEQEFLNYIDRSEKGNKNILKHRLYPSNQAEEYFSVASPPTAGQSQFGFDYAPPLPFDPQEMIDSFFDQLISIGVAGYSYAIVRNGTLLASSGVGSSRTFVDGNKEMTAYKRLHIASISKPVTAVGIMHLIEKSSLTLDTKFYNLIKNSFPDAHSEVKDITVRHLLNQNSGLDFQNYKCNDNDVQQVLKLKPKSSPESKYEYNNINYYLLRRIIDHVSGTDYTSYIQSNILNPMTISTMSCERDTSDPTMYYPTSPNYLGQYTSGTLFDYSPPFKDICGAFGWYACAIDLAKFLAYFRYNKVISSASTNLMLTSVSSANTNYALGWRRIRYQPKGTYYGHSGSWFTTPSNGVRYGMRGIIMRFPYAIDSVLLVNSREQLTQLDFDIYDIMINAFHKGVGLP